MQLIFFVSLLCTLCFAQGDILFNDASDISFLDDDFNDYGNLGSPGLFEDDSVAWNSCSTSTDPLGRRGISCKNTDEKPDIEIRPLGRTKDDPLLPSLLNGNPELCDIEVMGMTRTVVMCDSGLVIDRLPQPSPDTFDLENCTPCTD